MWPSKTDKAVQESGRRSEGAEIEGEPPAEVRKRVYCTQAETYSTDPCPC